MYLLNKSGIRVAIGVIGLFSAVFAPPWVALIAMTLLALRSPAWEVPMIGLAMDFLWLPGSFIFPLPVFTLAALVIVWGLEPLRSELLV